MKFKRVNKHFTLIIEATAYCSKYLLTKQSLTITLSIANENICVEGDSNGSKSSYGHVLHSYIWMPYSHLNVLALQANIRGDN
jgi:hypothetical protein